LYHEIWQYSYVGRSSLDASVTSMFNVLLPGNNYFKKLSSVLETKKAAVFDLAWETSLLHTENAMESLGGSYHTISATMELVCRLLGMK